MIKKLLIISSSLLVLAVIVFGVYNFLGKSGKTSAEDATGVNPPLSNDEEGSKTEEIFSEKITPLSAEPVAGATLTYDKTAIKYYHRDMGNVYQMLFDGSSKKTISATVLKDIIDVKWSPTKDKVITIYKDTSYPHGKKIVYFDYETKKASILDKNISDVIWLSGGNQIAYHYLDIDKDAGNVAIALPDGTGWKKIMDLNIRDIVLEEIPDQAKIAFHLKPTAYREAPLQTISTLGGDPVTVMNDQFGLEAKWSPDGKKVIVSFAVKRADSEVSLSLVDIATNELKELGVKTTIDKVAWSIDGGYIYYAEPETIPKSAVMPDDYFSGNVRTVDIFWRMDIQTKMKEQLTFKNDSKISYNASNIFLSPKEDQIFFVNKDDGKLYAIKL